MKRLTKPEMIKLVVPLKWVTFRHLIEQQDLFDIVESLWKILTNITFGQLLQDDTYKTEMIKALKAEKV